MDWQVTIEPVKGKSEQAAHDLPQAKTFEMGKEQIVFGRESNCDVVFPPEARMVGGRHGRLFRQESGDYAIEAFGDHYFEVNGYRPEQGQPLTGDSTIRFGSPKGPMIRVLLKRAARSDGLLSTLTQAAATPFAKIDARIKAGLVALAAVVVVAVAEFTWWSIEQQNQLQQVVRREVDEMRKTMTERTGSDFASVAVAKAEQVRGDFATTDALRAAAFAVILADDQGGSRIIGTAWPLQAGMLVTNAHIAKVMDNLKPHERLFVHKPGATDNILVTDKRIHPGYDAFNSFVDQATSKDFISLTAGAAMPSAYDVAILKVDPSVDLGGFLQLAADPPALKPGAPLAFAGYPIEGTGAQKLAQLSPNPILQFGRVTALADYFLFSADKASALLVENSLPATGGASGSPIVDADGKVVAVLSGGTVDFRNGVRTPSAAMLNYAQRADLIGGLLDPASFDLDAAKAEWQKALGLFDQQKDLVIANARSELEKETGGTVDQAPPGGGSLKTSEAVTVGTLTYRDHPMPVLTGHTYTFIAYGERDGTLNLMLLDAGKGVATAYGSSWFSTLTYTADHDGTMTLRVLGQASHQVGYDLVTLSADKAIAANAAATN